MLKDFVSLVLNFEKEKILLTTWNYSAFAGTVFQKTSSFLNVILSFKLQYVYTKFLKKITAITTKKRITIIIFFNKN